MKRSAEWKKQFNTCIHCKSSTPGVIMKGWRYCPDCGRPKRFSGQKMPGLGISIDECVNGHRRVFCGVGEMSDSLIEDAICQLFKPDRSGPALAVVSGAVYGEDSVSLGSGT